MANDNPSATDSKKSALRWLGLIAIGVAVGVVAWLRVAGSLTHEGDGTIRSVDVAGRKASIEIIDAANGKTRSFQGTVPSECTITINGKAATLAELREGDRARVRATFTREGDRKPGEKHKHSAVAERIEVTRKDGPAS